MTIEHNTCDLIRLEKLARRMKADAKRQTEWGTAMHPAATNSIAEIILECIGAPVSMPTREEGANAADEQYRGNPGLRAAFNNGVRWCLLQAEIKTNDKATTQKTQEEKD